MDVGIHLAQLGAQLGASGPYLAEQEGAACGAITAGGAFLLSEIRTTRSAVSLAAFFRQPVRRLPTGAPRRYHRCRCRCHRRQPGLQAGSRFARLREQWVGVGVGGSGRSGKEWACVGGGQPSCSPGPLFLF